MALAFDAFSEGNTGLGSLASAATSSWTHTPVGVPTLVTVEVIQRRAIAAAAAGVTYNGVAMARAGVQSTNTTNEVWYLQSPASGAQTVVVTQGANSSQNSLYVARTWTDSDVSGVGTSLGTSVGNSGTGLTTTVTISSAVGEIIADQSCQGAASGVLIGAADGSQTSETARVSGGNFAAGSSRKAHSVTSMVWTYGASKTWGALAIPVKPSAVVANPIFGMQEPMQHDAALLSW